MNYEDEKLLEDNGWIVVCESPFEIEHEDGSTATNTAAISVLTELRNENSNSKFVIVDLEYGNIVKKINN